MNTTDSVHEPTSTPSKRLPEVPRFFERCLPVSSSDDENTKELEPGEAQFRRDFQARWWPGDMNEYSPAPKG